MIAEQDKKMYESLIKEAEKYCTDYSGPFQDYFYGSFWFYKTDSEAYIEMTIEIIETMIRKLLERNEYDTFITEKLIPEILDQTSESDAIFSYPVAVANIIVYILPLRINELKNKTKKIKFELHLMGLSNIFIPEIDIESPEIKNMIDSKLEEDEFDDPFLYSSWVEAENQYICKIMKRLRILKEYINKLTEGGITYE